MWLQDANLVSSSRFQEIEVFETCTPSYGLMEVPRALVLCPSELGYLHVENGACTFSSRQVQVPLGISPYIFVVSP